MAFPSVYCIILSWNGRALTIDCIRSVLQSDYENLKILVVDNASSDKSAEAIGAAFAGEIETGKLILISNDRNYGFAGGNNIGLKYALEQNADYAFLLNNDTVVERTLFSELIAFLSGLESPAIAGPKIYYFDPPDQIWFAGGEIKLYKGLSRHIGIREKDTGQYNHPVACDYITGCGMMIPKPILETTGLLDTLYPLYSEDSDFCFRARQDGFRCYYVPQAKMWHKISAASGGQLKWRKIKLRLISNIIFLKRYAKWYHWLSIPVFQAAETIKILLLIIRGKIKNN